MQTLDNTFVSELEFEDDGMVGPKGESGDAPSLHISKVAPFLYKTEYKGWDHNQAETFVRTYYPEENQACAAVRKGSVFGHNYDAAYDDTAEFVVRTTARNGRHGSIGIAAIRGLLTTEMVDASEESDFTKAAYDVLPCFMIDGINDAGVAVALNQMPDEGQRDGLSDDSGMCALFAARYVLDYADSAEHAIGLLANQVFWLPENPAIKGKFYVVICDKTMTVFVDLFGDAKIIPAGENSIYPILTNFDINRWDGTRETLTPHANGLERYEILKNGYDAVASEEDLRNLLKSVRYTGVYHTEYDPFWFSDYNGDWSAIGGPELTIDSDESEYEPIVAYCLDKYENRTRDGRSMQTVHTATYDLDTLTLSVAIQEQDTVYRFCMDEMAQLYAERDRAMAAEQAIRDDFADSFYTKDETDELVEDACEAVVQNVAENYYKKEAVDQAVEDIHQTISDETDEKLNGKADVAQNEGEEGQVLYRTDEGSAWGDLPPRLPDVTAEQNGFVMAVENGEWVATDKFADYFRYVNLTVSIVSDNGGVPTGGINVTIKNADTEDVINQATYEGQPVTFRVPRGLSYIIEQSGKWEGYHNPTPDKIEGAATNDTTCVFTYEAIKVPETLRELQIIVDSGSAASLKNHIGLQFEDTYDDGGVPYEIIWDLKDVLTVLDADNHAHMGVVLEWHNATPVAMPFDAAERLEVDLSVETIAEEGVYYYGLTGSTIKLLELSAGDPLPTEYDALYKNAIRNADASIIRRGYGRYDESAVRKWLNSDEPAGAWWMATHLGDMPPAQAETVSGFMAGCSEQILAMAKPVRVSTAISAEEAIDVIDTFFIPSVSEVNGLSHSAAEGEPWGDWVDASGLAEPGNDVCPGRRVYGIGSVAAQEIGLRSANVGYKHITWDIKPDGSLDGYGNASAQRRYAPCCVVYK